MQTISFLRFPVAAIPESAMWWLARVTAKQGDQAVQGSVALRAASEGNAAAALGDVLANAGFELQDHQLVSAQDSRVESDKALVAEAVKQGVDSLIAPLGWARAERAAEGAGVEARALSGISPWLKMQPTDDERALPPVLDRMFFPDQQHGQVSDRCFAVLDAAKVFGLPERLAGSGLRHDCLFKGAAQEEWGDVAPWLVELDRDHPLARAMFVKPVGERQTLWSQSAGILLRSPLSFEAMRAHLRKYTMVIDEARNLRMYFRFYDPLTVRTILATMEQEELSSFMRGIRHLFAANPQGAGTLLTAQQVSA